MSRQASSTRVGQLPPADVLIAALQDTVRKFIHAGHKHEVSVNEVRAVVEAQFGLAPGSLKKDEDWKGKSRAVIFAEFHANPTPAPPKATRPGVPRSRRDHDSAESDPPSLPSIATRPTKKSDTATAAASTTAPKAHGTKRKRGSVPAVVKRSKEEVADPPSSPEKRSSPIGTKDDRASEAPEGARKAKEKDTSELPGARTEACALHPTMRRVKDKAEDVHESPEEPTLPTASHPGPSTMESEMSVVLDEDPKRKKRPSKAAPSSRPNKKATPSSKSHPDPLDADETEIKRLQSWLHRCGIRKLWRKELAGHATPRAKIKYLVAMLKEAGMSGRYSKLKAQQIRDERELQAELKAIQASAKEWGEMESDVEAPDRTTGPRLAKGLRELAFLNEGDGEVMD
ncbi:MAG: hypothetical protein M1826_007724 [Phylliscum demangeonii]|nr:MAG: hypothetical protein M1826_007724 [Phylliscum demangeonii]